MQSENNGDLPAAEEVNDTSFLEMYLLIIDLHEHEDESDAFAVAQYIESAAGDRGGTRPSQPRGHESATNS